jgi:hypothetical protein
MDKHGVLPTAANPSGGTARRGGANWEVCENNARSKILIWRKKKRYYMLILVTVQTQDPAIQSNQLMMSQSLPHVASVD